MRFWFLLKKRLRNFARLNSTIKHFFKVRVLIRNGASIYIHPVVKFKVILRLFSAPYFALDTICLPGERGFEKKLNNLVKVLLSWDNEHGSRCFNIIGRRISVPKFKNADSVLLNDLREVFFENVYGRHFPTGRPIRDRDVVLDLGANVGAFSIWACSQGTGIRCFAVEPHAAIRSELQRNLEINNLIGQVVPIEKCIGATNGTLRLEFNEDVFTMTRISSSTKAIDVPGITIDSLVEELRLDRLDFIKFDIEGAERIAISGASSTLKKFKPKLAISGYHLLDDVYFLINQILNIQPQYTIVVGSNMHIYAY